jgi:hypothetical protein
MPLTLQELRVCASFLRQARALCESVRDYFLGHDADCAARMGEISRHLDHEGEYVNRLIAKASPNGSGTNG